MRGHLLRVFQPAFRVFKIGCNARTPEGVRADARRFDPGLARPAFDHFPCPLPIKPASAQLFGLAVNGAEEGTILVITNPGRLDIFPQSDLQIVLAGHFMVLAAFFVQPYPQAFLFWVDVLDLHFQRR